MTRTFRQFSAPLFLSLASTFAVVGTGVTVLTPHPAIAAEVKSSGQFRGADRAHQVSGTAEIVPLKGGGFGLKLHRDFRSTGAPDLRVWLSEAPGPRNGAAVRKARHIDLDGLKSTSGEQIYRIPAGTDLSKIRSAVIWCRAFGVFFGAANLG
ncbi:DM13 domain-containing protein [Qipengyuania sp. XHP0207]|uniref:DM13 domain-containing protein n=1 Tax=Qipengyuania sp. XHP0207 TaxID=3038078 RepID=UPI00241FB651|nr:DM13 domain-containing protein [Qipengyuania sp. XHP0207]MDG5747369.1 DM13 domain-containing protein [Qipengyuania sp. XHP0207]